MTISVTRDTIRLRVVRCLRRGMTLQTKDDDRSPKSAPSSGGSRVFLRRGAPTPKVGVLTYFFGRKLYENERIWTPKGPLDPPMPRNTNSTLASNGCVDFKLIIFI